MRQRHIVRSLPRLRGFSFRAVGRRGRRACEDRSVQGTRAWTRTTSWWSAVDRAVPRPVTGSPNAVTACSIVEKKRFPRDKTCGDGLTPRAVRQLHDMGLAEPLAEFQRFDGLRSIGHGLTLELAWPEHPDFPSYGYVVRRRDLDEMVASPRRQGRRDALACIGGARAGRRRRRRGRRDRPAPRDRHGRDGAGPVRRRRRRREFPLRPGPRDGPGPDLSPRDGDPRLLTPARATTTRGSRATSTSATKRAISSRATGGSSRSATGRSTSASACSRRSRDWKSINTSRLMEAFCATAPRLVGDRDPRPPPARRPVAGSRPGARSNRASARRSSSSATRPAP